MFGELPSLLEFLTHFSFKILVQFLLEPIPEPRTRLPSITSITNPKKFSRSQQTQVL